MKLTKIFLDFLPYISRHNTYPADNHFFLCPSSAPFLPSPNQFQAFSLESTFSFQPNIWAPPYSSCVPLYLPLSMSENSMVHSSQLSVDSALGTKARSHWPSLSGNTNKSSTGKLCYFQMFSTQNV